ncbi:MAG: Lrp/AsnC family transcriptional regulator [Rhodospirillaceae bacterium]|jgi:siroheme decarboxylase|nr:Lrp/AsnC family transcriptional regulator [Rhodospirillaceae bacterium]MBT4219547.1 Lrp/AsnC family transcriptional regulator [Rhodospirillaceae bacterium]MBT4463584.1 Lrp/AsnC family transcriptional regulator [Rhodospirillaceae bacterium]MBT5014698.1 Lrp/AsnC family transcriptional regulator [Rhodospirillaceae bacterium]MBT5308877.1 Lrp/AsnC family transcriptional regulator [Rhodospirillaceae bacterium]
MDLTEHDNLLIAAIADGLPISARPYRDIGDSIGMDEGSVIQSLKGLIDGGVIKRFGLIVRHHELGYRANAMTVWDVPDDRIDELGECLGSFEFVTLCYQRPRRLPEWPYNLFCMVHGRERATVLDQIDQMVDTCGLHDINHDVLFSARRFKQRGAHYAAAPRTLESVA